MTKHQSSGLINVSDSEVDGPSLDFGPDASKQGLLEEVIHLVEEVSYDVLFAVIVFAHPVWVCLLTLFVFDCVPG